MKDKVLMGWDAAWTPNGSGAWAIQKGDTLWVESCPRGGELLERLQGILKEHDPDLIAMDFPLARGGVTGWREADAATTRAFSRYGCPVHSPTPERPGRWGDQIVEILEEHGYKLGLCRQLSAKTFVEVYPHTVLLHTHRLGYRLPYKAGRAGGYWPDLNREERKQRLLHSYQALWRDLSKGRFAFPRLPEAPSLSALKAVEDQIDALLCLRAAEGILEGVFLPFGDDHAAIWNPDPLYLPEAKRDSAQGDGKAMKA